MKQSISGIYEIVNIENGKRYIGSSKNIKSRFSRHKTSLRKNIHENTYLQNAWNKDGEGSFCFNILLQCEPENCILFEQMVLDGNIQHDYNICKTAYSWLGNRHTEETKQKMSKSHIGISTCKGFVHTEESRQRMRESSKTRPRKTGYHWSEEAMQRSAERKRKRKEEKQK